MGGIADPVPRGNSLGFSQLEQFFGHQPRWPPLVGRNASVEVAVLWLEAYLALASLAGSLCHDIKNTGRFLLDQRYSVRSGSAGSTRAARHAGRLPAISATTLSS